MNSNIFSIILVGLLAGALAFPIRLEAPTDSTVIIIITKDKFTSESQNSLVKPTNLVEVPAISIPVLGESSQDEESSNMNDSGIVISNLPEFENAEYQSNPQSSFGGYGPASFGNVQQTQHVPLPSQTPGPPQFPPSFYRPINHQGPPPSNYFFQNSYLPFAKA